MWRHDRCTFPLLRHAVRSYARERGASDEAVWLLDREIVAIGEIRAQAARRRHRARLRIQQAALEFLHRPHGPVHRRGMRECAFVVGDD